MSQHKETPKSLERSMQDKGTNKGPIINASASQESPETDPVDYITSSIESTLRYPAPSYPVTRENAASFLEKARIDPSAKIIEKPTCLTILDNGRRISIATLGSFSLIIGKAKSRKTFFTNLLIAAVLKNSQMTEKISGRTHNAQNQVLIFDTEQSQYHASLSINRICRLVGVDKPENLIPFSLRRFSPDERQILIEEAIYRTPNLLMVLIDGGRDLLSSINDEYQATSLVSKLLRWSGELNIHIMCVLHQNKGDNNARGHLGSELVNKAESVLSVTKDSKNKSHSFVNAEFCRDVEPEPFAFEIDSDGLPRLLQNWTKNKVNDSGYDGPDYNDPSDEIRLQVLESVFNRIPKQRYKQLSGNLKDAFHVNGFDIADNRMVKIIQWYKQVDRLKWSGKEKTKNCWYEISNKDCIS